MHEKIIIIRSDGKRWTIPTETVEQEYRNHYKPIDGDEYGRPTEYELEDWLKNNMNWEDIEPHLTLVGQDEVKYEWPSNFELDWP